ncbi:MAG: DNA polymerase I [Bacilli bacterium]|nr:DNA polymerase I [Bacilli bacterium]
MEKVVMIDGNNLMFRSYYATAYSGSMMKNSKGFPTNALYGFTNMINKIVNEEKPKYVIVAFDKGKTFRHDNYHEYKAGRIAMPEDLKVQFPVAKEMLDEMGIKWFEIDGYEADDIIGTFSEMVEKDDNYYGLIVSSDKDLLQLINDNITVKLLKTKDYIMMDRNTFIETYGVEPNKMIDIKGLMGDSSDNIPGVPGIGEKTALKLLQEYGSIENLYVNLDKVKGKLFEKLNDGKDSAFMSKQLATIFKEVPLNLTIDDIKYRGPNNRLKEIYEELEFYSFIKNIKVEEKDEIKEVKIFKSIDELNITSDIAVYLEVDNPNYHFGNVIGMGIYNNDISGFIPIDILKLNPSFLTKINKYTYDLKKVLVSLTKLNINTSMYSFDTMIAGYLLNYNIKDDIAYLANNYNYGIKFEDALYKEKNNNSIAIEAVKKAKFIYETKDELYGKLNECIDLFNNIEMPLSYVLADMELTGMKVDKKVLDEMKDEISIKIELLTKDIYNMAGIEFNINSPKQLGDILFDKIGVPANKKRATDKEHLVKYKDKYPIINKILEYKMLSKIYGTYIVGLEDFINADGKIHTIFNQTLTRTGRLSSSYPNLQNIPTRYEYAKLIRKAFVPDNDLILSSDYSQIELRILAHLSKVPKLIEAFKKGMDIHTKTAMEIFNVNENEVNSEMRRQAKAVNFGILYGISGFGLSENLDMSIQDAQEFIKRYLEAFPGVKDYMDNTVEIAKEKGYVSTIMNRKRTIDELKNTNYMIRQSGERIALNTPIQGSSADIIKKAMIELHSKMKELNLKSKMILQIHDELIFDVVKEEKKELEKLVKKIMENTYKLDVPLEVEISSGNNWYEAK